MLENDENNLEHVQINIFLYHDYKIKLPHYRPGQAPSAPGRLGSQNS